MNARATSTGRQRRKTLWVVAYAALALALLKPVCDVEAAVHRGQMPEGVLQLARPALADGHLPAQHDGDESPCCASMSEAIPGDGYDMAAVMRPPAGSFVDLPVEVVSRWPANRATRSAAVPDTALPQPSYYARSARIQR